MNVRGTVVKWFGMTFGLQIAIAKELGAFQPGDIHLSTSDYFKALLQRVGSERLMAAIQNFKL
jgi:hypothetical protein